MSTPNFKTQKYFDLYATNEFEQQNQETGEIYFDDYCYEDCESFIKNNLNNQLEFFEITLQSGYYGGVQTIVDCTANEFDAIDFLDNPQYYDNSELYNSFGYNTYVLKRKILADIKKINTKLLPQLKTTYNFKHIQCTAIFSNGEAIYEEV